MTNIKDYLTISEAARHRGVTVQAIQDLIYRGRLKAQRMGRSWLIHKRDLAAYTPDPGGRPKKK